RWTRTGLPKLIAARRCPVGASAFTTSGAGLSAMAPETHDIRTTKIADNRVIGSFPRRYDCGHCLFLRSHWQEKGVISYDATNQQGAHLFRRRDHPLEAAPLQFFLRQPGVRKDDRTKCPISVPADMRR